MINKIALLLLLINLTTHSLTIIVKCKDGIVPSMGFNEKYCCQKVEKIYKNIKDIELAMKLGMDRVYAMEITCHTEDTAGILREYLNSRLYESVEIDRHFQPVTSSHIPFFPNDPAFGTWQWSLHNDGDVPVMVTREDVDIDMPEGWGVEQGDSSLIIAILDSGLKNQNGEFDGRLWVNKNEIPSDKVDNDLNGYIDDVNGWNFAYGQDSSTDDNGHGTAITSIIAANANNGKALAGINSKSRLMVLKTSNINGITYGNTIAEAIRYATDHGAKVINFSHSSPSVLMFVEDAVMYAFAKGVLICAGSGNDGVSSVYFPAKIPSVLSVGATDARDKRSKNWRKPDSTVGGSNYGDSLDVVAPGDSVVCLNYKNGSTVFQSGTSIATAFVTGLSSLLYSQNPSITPDIVKQIIKSTAEDQVGDPSEDTKGYDKYYGYGRINAYQALLKGEELMTGKKPKALKNIESAKLISYVKSGNRLTVKTHSSAPINVRLLDASGRLIRQTSHEKHGMVSTVLLPPLSRGMYFYTVELDGIVHCGKIVN